MLVHVNSTKAKFDVQGRFEQLPQNIYGSVNATQLTSIVGKSNLRRAYSWAAKASLESRSNTGHTIYREQIILYINLEIVIIDTGHKYGSTVPTKNTAFHQ